MQGDEAEITGELSLSTLIRVRDDGMGMPADLLPRNFDLFNQADRSLDRSQGGLGIGLTLVRQLVELHGGSVEAKSRQLEASGKKELLALRDLGKTGVRRIEELLAARLATV